MCHSVMSSGSNATLEAVVRAMNRAQTPDELKKAYRRGALNLHPNKHGGNANFVRVFQNLQTQYERAQRRMRTGKNESNNESNDDMRGNATYRPRQRASTWNAGRKYRYDTRYDPGNATGFRPTGGTSNDDIAYEWLRKTQPILFYTAVLKRLPLQYQPCEPGYARRAPAYARCKRDARYAKQYDAHHAEFSRFGFPAGFIATPWGRARVASVLRRFNDAALIRKAAQLGFAV